MNMCYNYIRFCKGQNSSAHTCILKGGIYMSMFYHEFEFGFNYWYIVVPAMLLANIIYGYITGIKTRKVTTNGIKAIKFRENWVSIPELMKQKKFLMLALIFESFLAFVLITIESGNGIIQFLTNVTVDDPTGVYSLVIGWIICMLTWPIFYWLSKQAISIGKKVHILFIFVYDLKAIRAIE